jgi:hypothetical protein
MIKVVGDDAIVRTGEFGFSPPLSTSLLIDNPSTISTILTNVQLNIKVATVGLKVGTFFSIGGGRFQCRASALLGVVPVGYNDIGSLGISIEIGDLIGFVIPSGQLYADFTGGGLWDSGDWGPPHNGDYCNVGDVTPVMSNAFLWAISLCGGIVISPTVTTLPATGVT